MRVWICVTTVSTKRFDRFGQNFAHRFLDAKSRSSSLMRKIPLIDSNCWLTEIFIRRCLEWLIILKINHTKHNAGRKQYNTYIQYKYVYLINIVLHKGSNRTSTYYTENKVVQSAYINKRQGNAILY